MIPAIDRLLAVLFVAVFALALGASLKHRAGRPAPEVEPAEAGVGDDRATDAWLHDIAEPIEFSPEWWDREWRRTDILLSAAVAEFEERLAAAVGPQWASLVAADERDSRTFRRLINSVFEPTDEMPTYQRAEMVLR